MSAGLAERAILGVQTPRVEWFPPGDWDYTLGDQCVAWARDTLGQHLDEWEQLCIRRMLARRPNGKWVCYEFGICVCRRNGKSHILVIRFLFGLLVLGDPAAEYTAHHGKTARATFRLAQRILDNAPGEIPRFRPYQSAGRESIAFETGQEFAFSTRTKSQGRGTGADTLAVDEAQEADDDELDAITPTLGDRSISGNPQLIYAGSSGNFLSVVFGRVRRRAIEGGATRLGWAEWSIDDKAYAAADTFERERIATAVESIAQANPALGIVRPEGVQDGLSLEWLLGQVDILSPPGFAREHLGVGTWPKDDGSDWAIPRGPWNARALPAVDVPTEGLVLAISASRGDRSFSIAAAGGHDDDGCYGWLERQDEGPGWVIPDLRKLVRKVEVAAVVIAAGGPASTQADSIEKALREEGVPLHRLTTREEAQAFGGLHDSVTADPPDFWHRGQDEVNAALAGARTKDIGGGLWIFHRNSSETDIAPLEALAFARFGWLLYGDGDGDGPNIW